MENLDLRCAEWGQRLARMEGLDEKLLNETLTVLEEEGVYAFFLFLKAKGKKEGNEVSEKCQEFLQETPSDAPLLEKSDLFEALGKLAENLDRLLFARDLLRQVLVYALYHVKARDKGR